MKLERNYLTSDEINYIVTSLETVDDEFGKFILKYALIGQLLIKDVDWDKFENCNEMYDYIMEEQSKEDNTLGDLLYEVENAYVIDDILNKENSLEKVVERFLNGIENKIEEYGKSIDAESLKGLIGELKNLEVENEEVKKELNIGE